MAETHPDRTPGALPVEPPGRSLLRRRPLPVPGDVAAATLFLASSASSWITGVTLDIAGGKIML